MRKKINSRGFTLIELLIVIIIIGILAAIAFVAYSGATNKAHKASAESTLAEVKNKMGEYYADNNSYPAAGLSGATTTNVDNWLNSSAGGNNLAMSQSFTDANGFVYVVTPTNCGDTVASGGAITTGSTACSGYTLTADATIWGDSNTADNIVVSN